MKLDKLNEATAVGYTLPMTRGDLDPKTPENMKLYNKTVGMAHKHILAALKELQQTPKLDFMEDLPDISKELVSIERKLKNVAFIKK